MADEVEIANMALAKIGEPTLLTSLDDETPTARAVRSAWNSTRDFILSLHPWNFAVRYRNLASTPVLVDALTPHAYRYRLPEDCLRILDVDVEDYERADRFITADRSDALGVRYVAKVEQTAHWDAAFVEAFATRLAYVIAPRLVGDEGKRATLDRDFQVALRLAKGLDGQENPNEAFPDTSWVTARFTGGTVLDDGSGW